MTTANALEVFEPGRENFSLRARGQYLCKCIGTVDAVRVVRKWIETKDGVPSSRGGKGKHRAGTDRARVLKDAGRAAVVEAALIDRRNGKTLFLCRIDDLAFSREKVEHVVGN